MYIKGVESATLYPPHKREIKMTHYRIMWESKSGTKGNGDWKKFDSQSLVDAWIDKSNSNTLILNTWAEYKNK